MQILKRILLYSTIIAVLALAVMVVFGFLFQDKIVESVKNEINKTLNAEIKVDKIEFSLISNFPNASVNLENVVGFESANYTDTPDTLFSFKEFSLSFDFWYVVQDNFILESIHLTEGFVNLEIDKRGEGNYLIVQPDSSSNGPFYLNLESVHLNNCTVKFRDFRRNDHYDFFFPEISANGKFTDKDLSSALYGHTRVNALVLDGTNYLTGESGRVDVGIEYDFESDVFQISRGFVKLRNQYDFAVKGRSAPGSYNYSFIATNLDLNQTETLIPRKFIAFTNTYELKGLAKLELRLKSDRKQAHPHITGKFDVKDGAFINKVSKAGATIQKAKGRLDFGKMANLETAQLWVDEISFSTPLASVTGSFSMSNFLRPWYRIKAKGKVDLLQLTEIAEFGDDFGMSGIADLNVQLSGLIHDIDTLTNADLRSIKGQGSVTLNETNIHIRDMPSLTDISCQMKVNQKIAIIESLSGNAGNTIVEGEVKLSNWMRFIIDQNERMDIWGDLNLGDFATSDWISGEDSDQDIDLPDYLSFSGHIKASSLTHELTHLKNIETTINYYPKVLKITDAKFESFNGVIGANLRLARYRNGFVVNGSFETQNVDVSDLLSNYNNFGQTAVTGEQLKGDLNSEASFYIETDAKFNMNLPTMKLDGELQLLNGRLIENKLLTSIPKEIESNKIVDLFVNLDAFEKRLHNIKFDTITNYISIRDENIHIPKMHIISSALDIDIAGNHRFDNTFDYYMNFNLKAILTKKKLVRNKYGYIQDGQLGTKMIFLHLYTKNGEVEVDFDKDGSRKYKEQFENQEVKVAKSVLKKELGLFKNDTTIQVTEPEMTFDYELDLGEFGADTLTQDTLQSKIDTSKTKKTLIKKKKKKEKKEDDFEDWDFDDEDY